MWKEETKEEIAVNLLRKGMDIPFISEVTGMTKADVAKLQNALNGKDIGKS